MGLQVLAGFDHRRQGHGVVQQQPAGGRLLQERHPGGLMVKVWSERPSVTDWNRVEDTERPRRAKEEHQQPERNEVAASLALP